MCKYTIYTAECGHPDEDHVDSKDCFYFQKTQVHCDRDNPALRDRVVIKTRDREGICNGCFRIAQEKEEAAMRRDALKYQEQQRREAEEAEKQHNRAQQELRDKKWKEDEARREREKQEKKRREEERLRRERKAAKKQEDMDKAQQDAWEKEQADRISETERLSKAGLERLAKEQEESDYRAKVEQSIKDAERQRQEEEAQQALWESARLKSNDRRYQDGSIKSGSSDDRTDQWAEENTKYRTTDTTRGPASPPSPPPTPPQRAVPPASPPAAPQLSAKKSPPPPPPLPKSPSKPKDVNYTLPPVGPQTYGQFKVGTRVQPVHPSQALPELPATPVVVMPSTPAPFARLNGIITASDVPSVKELKGPAIPVPSAMRGPDGLKKSSGPRKWSPPVEDKTGVDPQLAARLAKRREWEPAEDDAPARSPGSEDAKRLDKEDFDMKRKTGWKRDSL